MQLTPRAYQLEGIEQLREGIRQKHRRLLLVMLMGAGKTITALEMIDQAAMKDKRCLFICDRRMLVEQSAQEARQYGIHCGMIMAGRGYDLSEKVQFVSKETLRSWALKKQDIALPEADLIVIDEAHRANGKSWAALKEKYPNAVFIGLTATPCNGDGTGLGQHYDWLVEPIKPSELLAAGNIVPARYYAPEIPDLKGVRMGRGDERDYAVRALAKRMNQHNLVGNTVNWYRTLGEEKQGVYFCCDVAHAIAVEAEFNEAGIPAAVIHARTEDQRREDIKEQMAAGRIRIVCNCDVMTEGVNWPFLTVAGILRPTKLFRRWLQMVGRVLRAHPGKNEAIVIDHAGCALYHPLAHLDHEWTLDPGSTIEDRNNRDAKDGKMPKMIRCPKCTMVFPSARMCPGCGHEMVAIVEAKHRQALSGTLTEVTDVAGDMTHSVAEASQQKMWFTFISLAVKRCKKAGFAAFLFKKRFGKDVWRTSVYPQPEGWPDHTLGDPAEEVFAEFVAGRGRRASA